METKSSNYHWLYLIISCLCASISLLIPFVRMTGTTFMEYLVIAFTGIFAIRILNLLDLKFPDYLLLFAGTFTAITQSFIIMNASIFFIFFVFFGVSAIRQELQHGKVLYTWLAFILFLLNRMFLLYIYKGFQPLYYQATNDLPNASLIKIGVFLLLSAGILLIDFLLIVLIRHFFQPGLLKISQLEFFYPQIARHFLISSLIIFIIGFIFEYLLLQIPVASDLALSEYLYGMLYEKISVLAALFSAVVIFIQLFILVILLKFSKYRFSIDARRRHEENLTLYNNDLEKNLSEVRGLKHDMKNILFTLSHMIEESGDSELKQYFQNTVNPYFQEELKKNDLYASLQPIEDEQLKAFLYYKFTSAAHSKCQIRFVCQNEIPWHIFSDEIDFLDFVRIIGIFLDNAMEEAVNTEEKEITILLTGRENACEIRIENSIRPQKEVVAGLSDKGLGRGNGLLIADQILKRYPNIILNSYTRNGIFVQSLLIQTLS